MRASKPFPSVALLALLLCQSPLAQTLPSGGTVVNGAASIQQNGANQVVTQTSQKAIINWQNFSIGAGGSVNFVQPNSSSVVLNRVIGNGRSEIYGKLTANGQVFIVNPNGVYFGAGSSVDVGGLLATTLGITDTDFLAGNYAFTRGSLDAARRDVINEGVLKARDKGYVVLAGDYAANRGIVQAKLGTVALASGNRMTLDVQGDSLINFAVNEKTVAQLSGVENSGQLLADGGRAIMTAAVATDLQTAVVNNTGLVRANTAEERNGEIILSAEGGNTQNSGTLDASGKAAGQTGGTIKVLGDKVALTDNALLDASGDAGGGNINVGGNYQGKGPLANAQNTSVDSGVAIKADALTNGNGGKVVVWADGHTDYAGGISAQGGAQGGDGGNVEVSGKATLNYSGKVTTLAAKGKTGNLLLDPTDISILNPSMIVTPSPTGVSQITVGDLETALNASNVTLQTSAGSGAPNGGTITIDDGGGGGVQWSSGSMLKLQADNKIVINSNVQGGNGTIWLDSVNGATQAANTNITANGLLLTGSGNWDIAGVGSTNRLNSYNNVNTFAANINGGLLRFSNNTGFTVGTVQGVNGITHTNGNTQLYADNNGGVITLAQSINSGSIYIRASGGTNQTGGSIVAGELAVAGGAANLTQSGNNLARIAASVNGTFKYRDADRVEVGSVFSVNGITTNNQDVTITTGNSAAFTDLSLQPTTSTASLVLNQSINAGTGNVRLTTGTGGIYQRHDTNSGGAVPNGSITANALLVKGDNANSVTPFVLTNAANRVNTLAASANGSISFAGAGNSSSTLTIGTIDSTSGITTTSNTTVSSTTNPDGSVTSSTNENNISLSVGGNLNIDKNLTASTATGTDTVSIGIGGDFTARTASGIKVTADTMGVFGDDMQGSFSIVSNVANLAAAGGKIMVIDNSAYTGTLAGIGIGASATSATATNGGSTATINSSDKPVGDFYLTTGGGLNIIKLNSKGQNLMLRSTSLSILLEAITADNARIMLQPLNSAATIGISNSTEPGWTPDINYDANTLLKFSNPVSTFYFGTPSNAILNDINVPNFARNISTGDIHIGYDGAFNLGYRSLSAQTSGNMVAYNVGPLYNLRLAAPNLTIHSFNTFGDQIHLFSNNLSLPGTTADYINPYKPRITYRSLNDQTIWVGHSYVANEPQILPSTLVKLPDGSTIIISGSTDYPFPNGGAGYGDIHIPWDDGIVLLGNRKLILSTGHTLYTYNATPTYTKETNGGTSGGLWQGCQNLTTCAGTNPSPYPDPTPGNGGTGTGDGSGDGSNSNGDNGGCKSCPPANPNNNPYPPDTSNNDNGNGNGNGSNGNNNSGNGNGDDGSGLNSDGGGDGGGGIGDGGNGDGNNGTGSGDDGAGNTGDGSGDGGAGIGSGGDGSGDNGSGLGDGGNGDGNNGAGTGGDGSGNTGDGSGDGGAGTGSGGDGSGDNGSGLGDGGNGDGNNGAGSGGDGSGNTGDGSGDGGAGTGSGGDGSGDNGSGLGDGGNGDGNNGAGTGGDGSGNTGDGNGDGGAGTGSGGASDNGNGDGLGAGDGDSGAGNGNADNGDGNGDAGAGDGSGGNGDGAGSKGDGDTGNGLGNDDAGDGGKGTGANGDGDNGAGTGSGGLSDGNGDTGDGAGDGGNGSGNMGNGDGSGRQDNGADGDGSGNGNGQSDSGNGNGDAADGTASPAFDISCGDLAQTRQDKPESDRKGGKELVEVKHQGLQLRDPCQQQAEQQNRKP